MKKAYLGKHCLRFPPPDDFVLSYLSMFVCARVQHLFYIISVILRRIYLCNSIPDVAQTYCHMWYSITF